MDFTKILCLALAIVYVSSQPPALNRRFNIFVGGINNNVDPRRFILPPDQNIRVDVEDRRRQLDVVGAMRNALQGLLLQAQGANRHHWVAPYRGRNPTRNNLIYNQGMTLQDFLTQFNLTFDEAALFLNANGFVITRAMLHWNIIVTVEYHATNRGRGDQHHTLQFRIYGLD